MLIDTHTHLYDEAFNPDGGGLAAVERALAAGVGHMILPNVDRASLQPLLDLAAQRPDVLSVALGLHPTEVRDDWRQVVGDMLAVADTLPTPASEPTTSDGTEDTLTTTSDDPDAAITKPRLVAIGEVGIDLYWDKSLRHLQIDAFEAQLDAANRRHLPVIIHCREALDDVVTALSHHPGVQGVMHSFGGTVEDVERVRAVADMYFGFNGIATFKNCRVTDAIEAIGLDRLLLETDSPYLAPVPKRGRRCESAYLAYTAQHIADTQQMLLPDLAAATTANARRLFGI